MTAEYQNPIRLNKRPLDYRNYGF